MALVHDKHYEGKVEYLRVKCVEGIAAVEVGGRVGTELEPESLLAQLP